MHIQQAPHAAARQALEILCEIGIQRLWLVMDEIEDITDVQRDGLPSKERQGIDQGLLTVIPRVIKAEEARQELPQVNFLLLCSQSVGDLLRQIRAIERRTGWHELTSNSFADVTAFFDYLRRYRPRLGAAVAAYPPGLKEAAFFAANRNFGWFNVLMHHAHGNHRGGAVSAPDLLRLFAESATTGGQGSVFDTAALGPMRLEQDADYDAVVRAVYSLLPQEIGAPDGIDAATAGRFLQKLDHGQTHRPLFTRVLEITPPAKTRVMAHMVASGFRNTRGTELALLGEVDFDLEPVLSGLEAYAIGLPPERRGHWLICEDETEFTHQIAGLSPYPEQAQQFAPYLHGLLLDPAYRVRDPAGGERVSIAPAFSFLRDFNRLNRARIDDQGYLRDASRNSRLEEAFLNAGKHPGTRARCLLQGLANAWEQDAAPAAVTWLGDELGLPALRWSPGAGPLDLAAHGQATLLDATGATDAQLDAALQRLASRRVQEGAEPIVLLLQEQPERAKDLLRQLPRRSPSLAPMVVVHGLVRRAGDDLVRLGLLGQVFESADLRTSHFHAVIGQARQHLARVLDIWVTETLEQQGMVLRPLFYGSKVSDADIRLFARGYTALCEGRTFHEITQAACDVFDSDAERDRFKKVLAKHADPGPKFAAAPREPLIELSDGDYRPRVARPFVSFMQRCGDIPKTPGDLERWFLFDLHNERRETLAQPRDVLRAWALFLEAAGLLQEQAGKFARVSAYELKARLEGANNWLQGPFQQGAERIEQIHGAAGKHLMGVHAKTAQQRLKDAGKKLDALDLDYLGADWTDLNAHDGSAPRYVQRLEATLDTVRGVREDIHWIYDPGQLAIFRYNAEALAHYQANQNLPGFPLWRRLEVLRGFYDQLAEARDRLLRRVAEVRADIGDRVPQIESGPDAGAQAFPTQPLTLPLDMIEQELRFDAEHPNKTVVALGTTLGVSTMGFLLVSGKLGEVNHRLETLRADLFDPGRLVANFDAALDRFLALREDTEEAARRLDALAAFLADAPAETRRQFGLDGHTDAVDTLRGIFFDRDIRQPTDEREAARHRVQDLLPRLIEDLDGQADKPRQTLEAIASTWQAILPSITAVYQSKHGVRLNALYRIRRARGGEVPNWPDRRADTWGATIAAFDAVVEMIDREGADCFAGETETTFEVFVALCGMDLDNRPVDWSAPEHSRHAEALMRRGLLRLELLS